MSSLPRLLGFALALLLVFLAAAGGAQVWLRNQHDRLQDATLAAKRQQFEAALALAGPPGPGGFPADTVARLAAATGGDVAVLPAAPPTGSDHAFAVALPNGQHAVVTLPVSPASRLLLLHQRVVVALLVLALALMLVWIFVLLLRPAAPPESGSRPPWGFAKAEMNSLQHLARTSVSQGAALAKERDERVRAQEEAYVNQVRLNQALEEKIRLGRDLHDGIIQSLYATGLTLENARNLIGSQPAEAATRLDQSIGLLNAAIRDVRNYISGLTPDHAREAGLTQIVEQLAADLRAGRSAEFEIGIDDAAAARLGEERFAQAVQVIREAISNALRHGGATRVSIRLHEGEGSVALAVQDNGRGFDLEGRRNGHGLANMRGRAESAGGSLQVESAPGRGTRIVLTLPLAKST